MQFFNTLYIGEFKKNSRKIRIEMDRVPVQDFQHAMTVENIDVTVQPHRYCRLFIYITEKNCHLLDRD